MDQQIRRFPGTPGPQASPGPTKWRVPHVQRPFFSHVWWAQNGVMPFYGHFIGKLMIIGWNWAYPIFRQTQIMSFLKDSGCVLEISRGRESTKRGRGHEAWWIDFWWWKEALKGMNGRSRPPMWWALQRAIETSVALFWQIDGAAQHLIRYYCITL